MLKVYIIAVMFFLMMVSFAIHPGSTYPEKLSDWGIFKGKLADLNPEEGVVPYGLNTPLYTDYAEKLRFIKLPKGSSVNYVAEGMPDFPVGTILVKTFYYSADFRKPGINKQIIETRLLVKEASAWKALTYIWNAEQTDADWEVAGDEKQVAFIDKEGVSQSVRYVIPNQNQCKGCHNRDDRLSPIGPSVSQLNGDYVYASGKKNQLKYWKRKGMMLQVPKISSIPRTAVWNDPASGDLNARARAYLAINCAHCHSKTGPAQSSGLFLTEHEKDSTALGFLKTPVAAGKGSGGRSFDILPGDAESSIIWYRMQTRNPGERMPELGRNLVHKEGLALIREWINTMKKQ